MKLLRAKSVESTHSNNSQPLRRGDLIDPATFELPSGIDDGPLDEVLVEYHYDATETLKIEGGVTDMIDLETIQLNGKNYRITEKRKGVRDGEWDLIKCVRSTGEADHEQPDEREQESATVGTTFNPDFIWRLLRDAERGLNRRGVYAEVDLGAIPYEVRLIQDRMKSGDFLKAREMLKDFSRSLANAK